TPLSVAVANGHIKVVRLLLAHNADTIHPATQQTGVHTAAAEGHMGVLNELVLNFGASTNTRDKSQRIPLYFAAEKNMPEVVTFLLEKGNHGDIKALDRRHQSVLFKPAGRGYPDVVDQLIEAGVDIHCEDLWKRNALHWAARGSRVAPRSTHVKIAKKLLALKVNPNLKDQDGRTPLFWANEFPGGGPMIKVLVEGGADIHSTKDRPTPAPLHLAARIGNALVVEILLTAGADVNASDILYQTPLQLAATRGHVDVVERL
ncbi:ankyrin, partial [Terfezia boudieri ATCC MYA-4762]